MVKKINKFICFITLCLLTSCVSPKAVDISPDTKLANFENRMDQLQKIVDQQASQINNSLGNFRTTNIAEKITSGGGWIVLGTSAMALIFILAILYYLKSNKSTNLLKLVTTAINRSDKNTIRNIKDQIEHEVGNGGPFCFKNKKQLAKFVKQYGVFAEDDK